MVCVSATSDYVTKVYFSDNYNGPYTLYKQIIESVSGIRGTGVTCQKIGGTRYVLSGSSHTGVNKFHVLSYPDLNVLGELNLDYPTGARYGIWPNVFPVIEGEKTYYWLVTFDRAISNPINNYSYGAIYAYKSAEANSGMEYPIEIGGSTLYEPISPTYGPLDLHFNRQWSKRNSMAFEMKRSEISIHQNVLIDQSNVYPTLNGSGLRIETNGLYLAEDGEDVIIGGEHQPFAVYVLSPQNIRYGDKRYIAISDANRNVVVKIMVDEARRVYVSEAGQETQLAQMTANRKELIICTGSTMIYLYER